ncbi:hypothetical protein HGRIS_013995 [Hohenbuehelia grisea]|uniref:Uncharacterized protein n=1 Tax=Hohenbuehelia grisea TaxID=104357 RepID=A0ABR3JU19_9AGAR
MYETRAVAARNAQEAVTTPAPPTLTPILEPRLHGSFSVIKNIDFRTLKYSETGEGYVICIKEEDNEDYYEDEDGPREDADVKDSANDGFTGSH